MAFLPVNLTLWSSFPNANASRDIPQWWAYITTTDNVATVSASGYFNIDPNTLLQNTSFHVGDLMYCLCSDAVVQLEILTVTPNVTTSAFSVPAGSINTNALANGAVTNVKVNAAAAIDFSKLAALTSGHILVGSAGNVPTSVVMSGDATIIASGALTIANLAVTAAKIANATITGAKIAATTIAGSNLIANTVASAELDLTTIQYVKVPVTAAQFNGMYAAPFIMIAAPGANKMIVVKQAILAMTFVSAQYLVGGNVALQYDSTAHGAGTLASAVVSAVTVDGYAASSSVGVEGAQASAAITTTVNKGLYLSNDTAAFTTGDGTWNVHIWYEVVTL